jgi:hypothetical protein
MPLPTIAGALRCVATGMTVGGGRWANTWHAHNDSGAAFDLAAITAFHAIFSQFYVGPDLTGGEYFLHQCSSLLTVDKFAYTPLDGSSGAFEFPMTNVGAVTGGSAPAEVAEVLTIRTASRGRQNRGRVYLPAMLSANYSGLGHISSSVIPLLLGQIAAVETAIESGGAHLGVGSYGPYKSSGTPHFTPVTHFTMDDVCDVQRRRKS